VSYRTAAILTVGLVFAIFVLPHVVIVVLLPSLAQGPTGAIPGYAQPLFEFTALCYSWRIPFAFPIIAAPFSIAALSGKGRVS
jgi:hypothetical protein